MSKRMLGQKIRRDCLRISDETWAAGPQILRVPGIFEIRCIGSGRRYIGSSIKPHLRRATYYYFLRNPMKLETSNIFFGNKRFLADLEQYGVEAFEFHMLSSHPGATDTQLNDIKWKLISAIDKSMLYNRDTGEGFYVKSLFIELDDEVAALYARRCALKSEIETLKTQRQALREWAAQEKIRIQAAYADGSVHYLERAELLKQNSAKWKQCAIRIKALTAELSSVAAALTARNAALADYYSQED